MFSIIQAAGWPIWPLLICSVVALALVLERMYSLADKRIVPQDLLDEAIKASRHQLPSEDSVKHLASHSVLGRVLASGLLQLRQQPQSSEAELSESIENAGKKPPMSWRSTWWFWPPSRLLPHFWVCWARWLA